MILKSTGALVAALCLAATFASAAEEGDPVAGEALFRLCAQCHTVTPRQNRLGPSLHGIVGAPAAQVAGYRYSPVLRNSGIVWTTAELDRFLENPQAVLPRSRMAFTGISDSKQRADVIAYLATFTAQ